MAITSILNLRFNITGGNSLAKMRNLIKGVGEQSYKTFNAMSRSMNVLEKSTSRTLGKLALFVGGGGLMTAAFRGLSYALIQSNALITTNRILLEEVIGNKGKAKEFINVIQEMAGSYGQDMSELMTASRGVVSVMRQIDKSMNSSQLERMLKMIMTVSAMDTENRGLAFTAFSFKEALQAIGQGDWRSMKNRLEINLGKTYEKAITAAFKKGNLEEGISLMEEAFENIGIKSSTILKRLLNEGLTQNLSRTASYINRFFQILGEKGFQKIAEPFARLNAYLSTIFKPNSEGLNWMETMSEKFSAKFIIPMIKQFERMGKVFYTFRMEIRDNAVAAVVGLGSAISNIIMLPIELIKGLFGISNQFEQADNSVVSFNKNLKAMGEIGKKIANFFKQFREPLNQLGLAVNNLIFALAKLFNIKMAGGAGGGIGAILSTGIEGAAGLTNTAANAISQGAGDKGSGQNDIMSTVGTGLTGLMLLAMLRGGKMPKFGKGKGAKGTEQSAGSGIDLTRPAGYGNNKKNQLAGLTAATKQKRELDEMIRLQENKVRAMKSRGEDLTNPNALERESAKLGAMRRQSTKLDSRINANPEKVLSSNADKVAKFVEKFGMLGLILPTFIGWIGKGILALKAIPVTLLTFKAGALGLAGALVSPIALFITLASVMGIFALGMRKASQKVEENIVKQEEALADSHKQVQIGNFFKQMGVDPSKYRGFVSSGMGTHKDEKGNTITAEMSGEELKLLALREVLKSGLEKREVSSGVKGLLNMWQGNATEYLSSKGMSEERQKMTLGVGTVEALSDTKAGKTIGEVHINIEAGKYSDQQIKEILKQVEGGLRKFNVADTSKTKPSITLQDAVKGIMPAKSGLMGMND